MPWRPRKACSYMNCPELIPTGETYCTKHKEIKRLEMYQRRTVDILAQRFYQSARWKTIRAIVLREEPLCRHCYAKNIITMATEVDHIDGNYRNVDRSNLQPLCKPCHSKKTAKEQGGFGNRGRGV